MNLIYETYVGSTLYNLKTSSSDIDKKGILMPSKDEILGILGKYKEKPESKEIVIDGVKVEWVHFPFMHYMKLMMKCNATVLELAFADDNFKLVKTDISEEILKFVRENMICKDKVCLSYFGYVKDQFEVVKMKKASNQRLTVIEKYGFDVKAASHVYRLAKQSQDLLNFGSCNPTLTGETQKICLGIKQGSYDFNDTIDILTTEINKMKECKINSTLKEFSDEENINQFVISIHEKIVKG